MGSWPMHGEDLASRLFPWAHMPSFVKKFLPSHYTIASFHQQVVRLEHLYFHFVKCSLSYFILNRWVLLRKERCIEVNPQEVLVCDG